MGLVCIERACRRGAWVREVEITRELINLEACVHTPLSLNVSEVTNTQPFDARTRRVQL